MEEIDSTGTGFTDRQVQVLRLREQGLTQQEVADRIGTTGANVSAVERNARENIEEARRTLECARIIRTAARVRVDEETAFDDIIARIYDLGDEQDLKVAYRKPELYGHVYEALEPQVRDGRITVPVEVGLTHDGEVIVRAVERE